MKTKNTTIMSNVSTTLSRRERSSLSLRETIVTICLIGTLAVSAVVAVSALVVWGSPIVFFAALAAGCFCIDPLRSRSAAN